MVTDLLKGIAFSFLFLLGAATSLLLLIPVALLLPLHLVRVIKWRRFYSNLISGLFFDYISSLIHIIGGTQVHIYSDSPEILSDQGPLIITNHRSQLDCMFSGWCYGSMTRRNAAMKMLVKDQFRSVPIIGWVSKTIISCITRSYFNL